MTEFIGNMTASWYEASARERVAGFVDKNTFKEFIPPSDRVMSPHLEQFDITGAFDDGIVVGHATLKGRKILIAAQEGKFMGGTFGEVHGAKMVGLLRAALDDEGVQPSAVFLALDTGGVRLQEANAGEQSISEVINAIVDVREAGIPVIALVGGQSGAFGGGGIITATCSCIVIAEHARTSVSGPEVIETNKGVEEFDAKDKALVWRITGGRTRYLEGGADFYVKDSVAAFRETAIDAISSAPEFSLKTLEAEQKRLEYRLKQYSTCRDSTEMWKIAGLENSCPVAEYSEDDFIAMKRPKEADHAAR